MSGGFVEAAYKIRLCDVSSTHWLHSDGTHPSEAFNLTDRFRNFYESFEDQLPDLLAQRIFTSGDVMLHSDSGQEEWPGDFERVEVVLFSLPFPANQIVATVVLDFAILTVTDDDDSLLRKLLKAFAESRVTIAGKTITQIVDELAGGVGAERERAADPDEEIGDGARERHALVFMNGNGLAAPEYQVVAGILYGVQPPYRPEFTQLIRPKSLNREQGIYAAVSEYSSFLYGQQSEVENSVLLTTVQAVGTAARFQRIWRDAYFHVQQFQATKQAGRSGMQTREDLEKLADEMGNLELDLAFSVETAADLGLGSTTARIDEFHHNLYMVMQIKTRARTVGQMFVRLGNSLRSELTAIESREKKAENLRKQVEDDQRFRGALTLGVLSFILAPLGLVLAFFGVNTVQVDTNDSMYDVAHYWPIYVIALSIMIAPAVFAFMYGRLRRRKDTPSDQ